MHSHAYLTAPASIRSAHHFHGELIVRVRAVSCDAYRLRHIAGDVNLSVGAELPSDHIGVEHRGVVTIEQTNAILGLVQKLRPLNLTTSISQT